MRELIADGYLGERYALKVQASLRSFVDLEGPLRWREERRLSGANAMNMGIWYEATMRWWGHATQVVAQTQTNVPQRRDPETGGLTAVDVPDHIDVISRYADGASGTFQFSSVCGLGPRLGAWLFGSTGTLHYDLADDRLFGGKPGDKSLNEIAVAKDKRGGWRVEEEFVNAILGREEITHTRFEDGVRYMDFTEAVHQSAESGSIVTLPTVH
jgi:predicted dehydrogenase